MSNETFPVQTSTASKRVVGQLDLSELDSALAPQLHDPPTGFDPHHASRPAVATPTAGPHRYTIYVPHDEGARINIGAPHPTHGEPGITMRTNTHWGAWVGEGLQTALTLGAPASDSALDANKKTFGYAMQTSGQSNHFALFDVSMGSIVSGMNLASLLDLRIDSKVATVGISGATGVTLNSQGHIQIIAGSEHKPHTDFWTAVQALGLIAAEAGEFAAQPTGVFAGEKAGKQVKEKSEKGGKFLKDHASKDAKELAEYLIRTNVGKINKTLDHLVKIAGFVLAFKKTAKKGVEGKGLLKKAKAYGPHLLKIGQEIIAMVGDIRKSAAPAKDHIGDIDINAHRNLNINADSSVSLSGFQSVAINGFKKLTMTSLSASLTAYKSASLWGGQGIGLKALTGDVEIASDYKNVTVRGLKDVSLTSEDGKATVSADKDVQLNSATASAFVHGKKGAYIGAGEGKGYGVVMKSAYLTIGKHTNVDKFDKTVNEKDCSVITMKDKSTKLTVTQDSHIELTDKLLDTKSDKVTMTAKANVEIKGKKVLLG